MSEHDWELGYRLGRIRKERGETLNSVASEVGISAQFLSMVEKGRSGIGLSNLKKLAKHYSTPLSSLLETETTHEDEFVIHVDKAKKLYFGDGVESRLLALNDDNEVFEPLFFQLEKDISLAPMRHDGYEYTYVLSGMFSLRLEDPDTGEVHQAILRSGDSIHYRGSMIHTYSNCGDGPSSFICISTARILQERYLHPQDGQK